jgi:hypothetical protein
MRGRPGSRKGFAGRLQAELEFVGMADPVVEALPFGRGYVVVIPGHDDFLVKRDKNATFLKFEDRMLSFRRSDVLGLARRIAAFVNSDVTRRG